LIFLGADLTQPQITILDLLVKMNVKFCFIFIATLFSLGAPVSVALGTPLLADITAMVHGETYEGSNFEHLNNTVIEVNSTPPQYVVAKNGKYSFELMPGDYLITARYYQNNILTHSRETTFTIEDEGNYVFDLLLYPVSENPVIGSNAAKMDYSNNENLAEQIKTNFSSISYLLITFTLLLLLGAGYKLSRKHKKKTKENASQEGKTTQVKSSFFGFINGLLVKVLSKNTGLEVKQDFTTNNEKTAPEKKPVIEPVHNLEIETATLKNPPLPEDLQEILYIIKGHKGQITQKDLRSRLNYSEVKVSTMLSELEKRGLIKKFKYGRENIVILVDGENENSHNLKFSLHN